MKTKTMLFCFLMTASQNTFPQERLGAGILIGSPTAFSVQIRFPSSNTLDALIASNLKNEFFLQSTYDFHLATVKEDAEGIYRISIYTGPGIYLKSSAEKRNSIGISGSLGFAWLFRNQYEFFLEYSPKIGVTAPADVGLTGGFGFRYVF